MKLLHRKSKWEKLLESVGDAAAGGSVRQAGKVTLGVVGGVIAATAASAAVSTIRRQEHQ